MRASRMRCGFSFGSDGIGRDPIRKQFVGKRLNLDRKRVPSCFERLPMDGVENQ